MIITKSQWQTAAQIESQHAFQEVIYILLAGSVGALLGEESDSPYRGSIIGVFGLLGGFGILATTFVGGQLFDTIG